MKEITRLMLIATLVGSLLIPYNLGVASDPVTLSINDVAIPVGGTIQGFIHVTGVQNLGSFGITLGYDPAVVQPTAVAEQDVTGVNSYINTASNLIILNWYTTGSVSGDYDLAAITFAPAAQAQPGDSCPLILIGNMYDNTPAGNPIAHTTQNGVASIAGGTGSEPTLSLDNVDVPLGGTVQ